MTRLHNFDLFITRNVEAYNVQAHAASVGELPAQALMLPFEPAQLHDRRRDVAEWIKQLRTTRLHGPAELQEARAFGETLFTALFTGEILAGFRASRSNIAPGEQLRLRLRLPPALVMLPWELLYDSHKDEFLALASDLTLVRYPEMPTAHHPGPLRVEGPLRVVAVLASPQSPDYPPLRIDRELNRLERALTVLRDRGRVQLDVIRGAGTLDQVRERLRQPAHIMHIFCHGDLNRESGEGELLFEDTDGAAEAVNAELIGRYLQRQQGQVQLVTLNACLGALPVGDDPFGSVGLALIRSGVPAVVAMQFEIAEDVAAELTRVLYSELAAGTTVDRALSEARLHISARYRTRLDWAIPVLFSRAASGVLFEFATPLGVDVPPVAPAPLHSPVQHTHVPIAGSLPPFIAGPPITHPRLFFGRERIVSRIFGLLRHLPLQNTVIIGPRRSGKTSLLHYLSSIMRTPAEQLRPGQRTDWLVQPERYRWVMVNFQDARMSTQAGLLRYLLTSLDLPVPEPCTLDRFLEVMSHGIEQPTVILLDEIGKALQDYPELDDDLWESLRSLGPQVGGNLGFVLATHVSPVQLAYDSCHSSPFFNIFGYTTQLGPFSVAEARALIDSAPIPFSSEDIEWILAQSGCWPILLQVLCRERLIALEMGETGDAWREEAMQQMAPFRHYIGMPSAPAASSPAPPIDRVRLRQFLTGHFNESELRDLCFDLHLDYENLPGSSKADRARELITYCERHSRMDELVALCRGLRPDVEM